MIRIPRPEPAGVLVVTVWSEADGLRRVVSLTDPGSSSAAPTLELQRNYAASDKAVLNLVRHWLEAVEERTSRSGPSGELRAERAGDATVTPAPRSGDGRRSQ
ncbi:MAG TPA: hypothetical protein VK903_09305 [Propionicimonas sp.]|nr:hypothetical protein [Propionicimonas sp.]